ncbi:MAG: beta-N-acetylglucosaminidase domain-containing protein [Spongiibacteraceae bacterium]
MFTRGVIEGFYGRAWPWPQRRAMIDFLAVEKFDAYVYAPKADTALRRAWREPHAALEFDALLALREHSRQRGVAFGIGFSPWGLQSEYGATDRAALRQKFTQLNQLDPDWLCILFDDMPGSFAQLAQRQAAIVADLMSIATVKRVAMCPTYYSFDPVLEELFGPMPSRYLEDLGVVLDPAVDIFWTGSHVLAPGFTQADIDAIATRIQRKPTLWDNYPVNDGRKSSRFLNLLPVRNRPAQLSQWCAGHFANPMNQPLLSQLPLASLAASYKQGDAYDGATCWPQQLRAMDDRELAHLLARDAEQFQVAGLDGIAADERARIAADYRRLSNPAAWEVADWLDELYRFDPACLND